MYDNIRASYGIVPRPALPPEEEMRQCKEMLSATQREEAVITVFQTSSPFTISLHTPSTKQALLTEPSRCDHDIAC